MLTITLVYEIPHVFFSSNFYYIIIYRSTGYLKTTRNDPLQEALTDTGAMQGRTQTQGGALMRRTGATGADAARRPGASTGRAGQGYRHDAQAGGIDTARMPGASTRRAEARVLALRAGPGALMQRAGALTRHAWMGLTQHAGVSTQHARTGGIDAEQGCSQGEGRWQHEKENPSDSLLGRGGGGGGFGGMKKTGPPPASIWGEGGGWVGWGDTTGTRLGHDWDTTGTRGPAHKDEQRGPHMTRSFLSSLPLSSRFPFRMV